MTAPSGYDPADYPPFAVTVDLAVFTLRDGKLMVTVVERGSEPFQGRWALPGGFVQHDEDLVSAARRELAEETGLQAEDLTQIGAYGEPGRDPRMRVVTVAYWALVPDLAEPRGGGDAAAAQLVEAEVALADPDRLAFDHHRVLTDAVERIGRDLEQTTVAARFCPEQFTIDELRSVYEAVWGVTLNRRDFEEKALAARGFLVATGSRQNGSDLFTLGPATTIDPPIQRPGRDGPKR